MGKKRSEDEVKKPKRPWWVRLLKRLDLIIYDEETGIDLGFKFKIPW